MAIARLKKLTFCGLKKEKELLLEKLQVLGGAHLISLNTQGGTTEITTHKHTEKAIHALKYLNQCANKRHQMNDKEVFHLDEIVDQVLDVQLQIRMLTDQRDFLMKRIEEVKHWGDFNLAKEGDLAGIRLWFYIVPKRLMQQLHDDLIFQVVHKDNIHCYVVVLAEQEPPIASVPVPRTHTGKIPLSQLVKDLQTVELALQDKQAERESLTRWIALITMNLAENEDHAALKVANALTLDDHDLFAIQAWVPSKQLARFETFASTHGMALLVEDVNEHDHPPTLLENTGVVAGGEEVIKFYQTPAYNTWDPSIVVFFSFAFFFAMILSDAGYALVFAVILAIKWKTLGHSFKGLRLRHLATVTIIFSIIWGVLSGGYFGYNPSANSVAGFFKILDINDFDSMMRLSICIGAIHIIMANLVTAYQSKGKKHAFAALGWVSLVIAGVLFWLAIDNTENAAYGFLILGGVLLLFFSNERRLIKPVDYFWQILDGIKNITAITKIFGDILSYMRLFALGLASASLAITFNQLAEQVYSSVSGLGLLFSILILILGHTLNLLLCLMSGVVHGLRLNFIEFYNWSVSDEGYPFNAFSKKGGR
ncbi:MAG: ATPase [Methylococcaceae bacterium]|nr:ATPase [Methylococcaceae bacterium]